MLHQRRHPDDRRRAAAECGRPCVLGGEHDVEEKALLVGPEFRRAEIDLDRVGIDEMLRRLHDANHGIAKQRHGAFQELRGGHEIGVEDRDEFGRIGQRSDMFQRVVEVSSFGVRIVRPREIATAELSAKRLHPGAAAIVKHPDAKVWIVHAERADDRALQDLFLFVVRADEHVDRGRLVERSKPFGIRVRVRRSIPRPGEEHERERGGYDPDQLGHEKGERKRIFEADRRRRQRLRDPPPCILSHHGETARDHEGPSYRDRFWPHRRADEEKPQRHQRRLEGCENRIVDHAEHGLQLSEIEPLRCGPAPPLPARADSPRASPKETVPVRPIEHPAAPMSSMAIVT